MWTLAVAGTYCQRGWTILYLLLPLSWNRSSTAWQISLDAEHIQSTANDIPVLILACGANLSGGLSGILGTYACARQAQTDGADIEIRRSLGEPIIQNYQYWFPKRPRNIAIIQLGVIFEQIQVAWSSRLTMHFWSIYHVPNRWNDISRLTP